MPLPAQHADSFSWASKLMEVFVHHPPPAPAYPTASWSGQASIFALLGLSGLVSVFSLSELT